MLGHWTKLRWPKHWNATLAQWYIAIWEIFKAISWFGIFFWMSGLNPPGKTDGPDNHQKGIPEVLGCRSRPGT